MAKRTRQERRITMKAYTNIKQSKKLAEILPLESADMHYNVVGDAIIGDYQSGISSARSVAKAYKKNPDEFAKNVIPCWSLAALLDILSEKSHSINEDGAVCLDSYKGIEWDLLMENTNLGWVTKKSNPIDACYEMILKLHELKLL